MGEADELLCEASDPTTPGERLRELLQLRGRRLDLRSKFGEVLRAAARNPSLPLDLLRGVLADARHPLAAEAWQNPVVPLLLQTDPSLDYRDAAFGLLRRLADAEGIHLSVNAFSLQATVTEIATAERHAPEATELAAQIADLFGLTWGEP